MLSARKGTASHRLRCEWLAPHIPAAVWAGESIGQYDAIIYVKTAPWHRRHGVVSVLDVTDPFWRIDVAADARRMLSLVDAVTVPTQALAEDFRLCFPEPPAFVVRDGHDFASYPLHAARDGPPEYVWFGYCQNWPAASSVVWTLPESRVTIVSDRDVGYGTFHRWASDRRSFEVISGCDVAIIPRSQYGWKSNNREISAWAMGLAVARNLEDVERFASRDAREADIAARDLEAYSSAVAGAEMRAVLEEIRAVKSMGAAKP